MFKKPSLIVLLLCVFPTLSFAQVRYAAAPQRTTPAPNPPSTVPKIAPNIRTHEPTVEVTGHINNNTDRKTTPTLNWPPKDWGRPTPKKQDPTPPKNSGGGGMKHNTPTTWPTNTGNVRTYTPQPIYTPPKYTPAPTYVTPPTPKPTLIGNPVPAQEPVAECDENPTQAKRVLFIKGSRDTAIKDLKEDIANEAKEMTDAVGAEDRNTLQTILNNLPAGDQLAFNAALNQNPPDYAGAAAIADNANPGGGDGQKILDIEKHQKAKDELEQKIADGTVTKKDVDNYTDTVKSDPNLPATLKDTVTSKGNDIKTDIAIKDVLEKLDDSTLPLDTPLPNKGTIIVCPHMLGCEYYLVGPGTIMVGGPEYGITQGVLQDAIPTPPKYDDPVDFSAGDGTFTLVNATSQTIRFYLDDQAVKTLTPEQKETYVLQKSGKLSVMLQNRTYTYPISSATYNFEIRDGKLTLSIPTAKILLDNSVNAFPFNFIANGKQQIVEANQKLSLIPESGAVEIRFARDADPSAAPAVYTLTGNATYKIGIDKKDGKWALFAADAVIE